MNYQMLLERMTRSNWEHISSEDAAALEKLLTRVDELETDIKKYTAVFGDVVFPDTKGEGQSQIRRDIYANPAGWMYSFDGIRWVKAPMDIGKIDYARAMFRRIPAGISVGKTEDVLKYPKLYSYSTDNGFSWKPLYNECDSASHIWVYHGQHDWIWFKRTV